MANKSQLQVKVETPLRWPDSWPRTLIKDRINRSAWKKPMEHYKAAVAKELSTMRVAAATISYNEISKAAKDPGVALWYSLEAVEDVSWQIGLQLDNPAPTLKEIDEAYRLLALKHHPDRGGDIEMFKKLNQHRQAARSYVMGSTVERLDNCLPVDTFIETKQNLAGVRLALSYFRGLDRLGMPAIVRRVMSHTFKSALPAHASSEEKQNATSAT